MSPTTIVAPFAQPLLDLARRRLLDRLLPDGSVLVLVDLVVRWVVECSPDLAAFLESRRDRILIVETSVGYNHQLLDLPTVDPRLVPAATGVFLACHLDEVVGDAATILVCEDTLTPDGLSREQSRYPSNIRLVRCADFIGSRP